MSVIAATPHTAIVTRDGLAFGGELVQDCLDGSSSSGAVRAANTQTCCGFWRFSYYGPTHLRRWGYSANIMAQCGGSGAKVGVHRAAGMVGPPPRAAGEVGLTGDDLAEALRRVAALVAGQSRIAGLSLEVLPGATLHVRSSAAERQRRHRAGGVTPKPPPDGRDIGVTNTVTECDGEESSPLALPSSFIHHSENKEESERMKNDAHASAAANGHANRNAHVTQDVTLNVTESDIELPCPLNLVQRAEELEVLATMSKSLSQPIESVKAAAEEFVSYWTIGGGAGRRKTRWMRLLREHLRQTSRKGLMAPPGLLEHQRVSRETKTRHGGDYEQREAFDGKAEAARINAILRERKQKAGGI